MMFIPVIAVAINQHVTVARNLWAVKQSIALRFIWLGAICYTLASFEGSLEALRSVNTVTHFTQFTIGHAHLGARSEEHTSELQSLMRISYAVFCLKKKTQQTQMNIDSYEQSVHTR